MIGAIIGDIVGSVYEFDNHKSKEFPLFKKESTFTDDTVMTVAVADFLTIDNGVTSEARYIGHLHYWYDLYPNKSYGARFTKWIKQFEKTRYVNFKRNDSYGNGSAMRISPVGDAFISVEGCKRLANDLTVCSHNHPEAIKGAQAVSVITSEAIIEKDKKKLRKLIEKEFGYDLSRTVDELRKTYEYNETCQGTVPEAIICFLESTDFEDAIRNAISIGGDSDTIACITGGIAEAYYDDIPEWIVKKALSKLPAEMKSIIKRFYHESHIRETRKMIDILL